MSLLVVLPASPWEGKEAARALYAVHRQTLQSERSRHLGPVTIPPFFKEQSRIQPTALIPRSLRVVVRVRRELPSSTRGGKALWISGSRQRFRRRWRPLRGRVSGWRW